MGSAAITKGVILNLSSNEDVYERGERYFREGKLLSFKKQAAPEGGSVVRSGVEGNYKNYDVTLKLDDNGGLAGYTCSCESHSIWRGACKHVVAVLFAYMEGSVCLLSAETMRKHSALLTETLEQLIYDGINAELELPRTHPGAQVRLVPMLHCNDKGLYITLSIGIDRMYVIKNIALLVECCKREDEVTYGTAFTFTHRLNRFDALGQKMVAFLTAEDNMFNEVCKHINKHNQAIIRRPLAWAKELPITNRNMDAFFDIYEGHIVKGGAGFFNDVAFIAGKPPVQLHIEHTGESTKMRGDFPKFRAFSGIKEHYMVMSDQVLRLPVADGALVLRLLESLNAAPKNEIIFVGQEEHRFLSIILPRLQQAGLVKHIEGMPPVQQNVPLHAKLYLDADGMDIVARLEFCYGNAVIKEGAEGNANFVNRDVVGEYILKRKMSACGFEEIAGAYRLRDNDILYDFLYAPDSGLADLRQQAEVFVSEDLQGKIRRPSKPNMGIRLQGGLLNITLEDTDYSPADLLEALEAYRARKKYFRLKDGRFLPLEEEAVSAPLELLDTLDAGKKDMKGKVFSLPAYRAWYVEEVVQQSGLSDSCKRDAHFEKLINDLKDNKNLGFRTPRSLSCILRCYQKTGFRWLKTLAHYGFGGILADDMGLGKTIQIIALLESERRCNKKPSLVVAPTSLLYNWENEFTRFAPEIKVQVISGFPDKRRELLENGDMDVFITTYDTLKRDISFYKGMEFSFIVADEAQNIKNPATQAAKSIKTLKGQTRFALTGTPIENNLLELWSIFDFIMPGYLHAAAKFQRLYEVPIMRDNDRRRAAQLRQQIGPFVLRRIKANVLKELPEKTETTLPAELTPEQKRIYQAYLMEAIGAFDHIMATDAFADNRMQILAQLTRLRQICCHPALFIENYEGGSGKFELALETIQIALESGHRVLLFSQFTGMLAMLREKLDQDGEISYFYLDGATKARDRMNMTTRFNDGERDVFLISLKAGGTGLNLTGADVVIHYDPWWNPSVMDQASDRAHRYGQKKAVQVFNIVAKGSIEEKIMALQEKKRDLIDSVIAEGGNFINLLSPEEVRKLFVE